MVGVQENGTPRNIHARSACLQSFVHKILIRRPEQSVRMFHLLVFLSSSVVFHFIIVEYFQVCWTWLNKSESEPRGSSKHMDQFNPTEKIKVTDDPGHMRVWIHKLASWSNIVSPKSKPTVVRISFKVIPCNSFVRFESFDLVMWVMFLK